VADSKSLDERLKEYLDARDEEASSGYTNRDLHRAIKTVSDGLTTHEQEDAKIFKAFQDNFTAHHGRLSSLETSVQNLKDREEDSDLYNRHAVELATEARTLARGKHKSDPPVPSWIQKALAPVVVKVGLAVAGGAVAGMGWALHLIEIAHAEHAEAKETAKEQEETKRQEENKRQEAKQNAPRPASSQAQSVEVPQTGTK
jgi:hypothetical protein